MNKWWGYLHVEGTLHVKRYFGPVDISEAQKSSFVDIMAGPWECSSREEAVKKLEGEIIL